MSDRSSILLTESSVNESAQTPDSHLYPFRLLNQKNVIEDTERVASAVSWFGLRVSTDDPGTPAEDLDKTIQLSDLYSRLLGISSLKLDIMIGDRIRLDRHRAGGMVDKGTVFLHPRHFNPDNSIGRKILAHELTHIAQLERNRSKAGLPRFGPTLNIEQEARFAARKVIAGSASWPVSLALRNNAMVFTGPEQDESEPEPSDMTFDQAVTTRYREEIDRINHLLRGLWGFLWVTDGMVHEILLILQSVDFVTEMAIVQALQPGKQRTLVSNISSGHFNRFRTQILAIYNAVEPEVIEDNDEDIFDGMEWTGFTSEEHLALRRIREIWLNMGDENPWETLRNDDEVGESVRRLDDLGDAQLTETDLEQRRQRELTRISSEIEQRNRAESIAIQNDRLGQNVETIIRLLTGSPSDDERLVILDYLRPALREPDRMRAIAHVLENHESGDLIEKLVDDFPVTRLYQGRGDEERAERERLAGETRLTVLLRLVSYRAPWRNVRLAEDLLDTSFFSLDWMVNDEEAYLAHMLVQVVPEAMREGFLDEHQETIDSNVTQSMRESSRWNFYSGGEGRIDLANIQAQIMDPELWNIDNARRLSGLIRMAIAAGEHRFVFNQSFRQYLYHREAYRNEDFNEQIVDMYQLYNPHARNADGEPAPREEYRTEYIESMPWYREGIISYVHDYVGQGLDFVFSSENVDLLTNSIGGTGLNAVEFQDMFGGNFMGIRFRSFEELGEEGEQAREHRAGVNFIDRVAWDQNEGVLELEANNLAIESVRYPVGSLLFSSGDGRIRGLDLRITYPTVYNSHAMSLALSISSLNLNDSMLIFHDSMVGIEEITLETLEVNMGRQAILDQQDQAREGLDPGAVFFSFILPGIPSLLQILRIPLQSSDEMQSSLLQPESSTAVTVQWGNLEINGITTSSGMYIESLQLENFQLGIGGNREDYLQILNESGRFLTNRLASLRTDLTHVTDEEGRQELGEQIARVDAQRQAVWDLRLRIINSQQELDQIRARREENPESFDEATQERANELVQFLRTFDRGGVTLDSGRVTLRGMQGSTELGELNLTNIHGTGSSAAGLLSALTDSNVLTRIVEGESFQAPIVPGLEHEESTFQLDLGDIEMRDLIIHRGIPTVEEAENDLQEVREDLQARPWDPVLREERERLQLRLNNVREYHRLAEIGATYLTTSERQRLVAIREALTREEAFYAAHIRSRGTSLEIGRDGRTIDFHSERFDAFRPTDEQGEPIASAPGIRVGDLSIGEIHSDNFRFNLGLQGGLLAPSGVMAETDDLRRRLTALGFSGDNLEVIDIVHNRQNLSIDRVFLERFGINYRPQEGVLEVDAQRATVEGFRQSISEEYLQQEIRNLEAIPPDRITTSQEERLTALREALETLRGYYQLFEQLNEEIEQATDEDERSRLQGMLADAILMHQEWLRQIGARSIEVSDIGMRISGIGNVLDPDFDVEEMLEHGITIEGTGESERYITSESGESQRRRDRLFLSARITDTRFGETSAREIDVGETLGTFRYGNRSIGIENGYVEHISLTDFFLVSRSETPESEGGGNDILQIWSHGTSNARGITVTANLNFERSEDDNEYVLRHIRVQELHIDELEGNNLGFSSTHHPLDPLPEGSEDEYRSQTFELQSGRIGGIYATDIVVEMPRTEGEEIRIKGEAGIETFTEARVNAYIENALNLGHARIDGGALHIRFLEEGGRIIDIGTPVLNEAGEPVRHEGGLTITEGDVRTDEGTARFSARRLRGRILQNGDIYELQNLRLGSLTLQRFNWRAGAKQFSAHQPLTINDVRVDATIDRSDPNNMRVQLDSIHIERVFGNHFRYEEPPLTVEIRQDPDVVRAAEQRGEPVRPPLEIIDIDISNVQWSTRGGLQAGQRPGEGSIEIDQVHSAFDLLRNELDLDAVIDVNDINLRFLRDGSQVINVDDLDARAHGTAAEGVDIDVSIENLSTGDVTIDGRSVDIPQMVIPVMNVDHLHVESPSIEIDIPQQNGNIQFLNTQVDAHIQLAEEDSSAPFEYIEIFELLTPQITARNLTVTIPDVEISGETRDVTIRTSETRPVTITNFRLGEHGGDSFYIMPSESGSEFFREGIMHFDRAEGQQLCVEIERMFEVTTNFETTDVDYGSLIDGSWTLDLQQLRLTELEGSYGEHHFNVSTSSPERSTQVDNPEILLTGLRRAADGTIELDEASLSGVVYERPDWGIRLDIQEISLPQQLRVPGEGPFTIPAVDITNAMFSIDDILNMGGGESSSGSRSSGSILQDLNFLNALNGTITVELDLDYLPNDTITFSINHGLIDLNQIENELWSDFSVDFDLEGNDLVLNLDWGNAIGLIPSLIPQANYELARWNRLTDEERERFEDDDEAYLTTLIERFDTGSSSGGPPDPDPFLEFHNIQANLWMEPTRVNLGSHGEILLGGNGENAALGIEVTGNIPSQIQLEVTRINTSVNPDNPLRFGGTSIETGSLVIRNIHDTHINFTGLTPGRMEGVIGSAEARNIRINRGGGS